MKLKEAQKKVDEWIATYGVRYFNELTNMAILTEEVGELARIMARTYGDNLIKTRKRQGAYPMKWQMCSGTFMFG